MSLMDEIMKSNVTMLLEKGERVDRRGMFDYRPISVRKSAIATADGSAWVSIGNTQVLAAVKFDLAEPFSDRPEEGVLSVSAELLPMASPTFEVGPPDEHAIELARVVDRAVRSAEIIDLKSLYIEPGKAYGLYIDIYVLDYDGNYIDASMLASMAALRDAKIPLYEDGKLNREVEGIPLKLRGSALEVTFVKIGKHIMLDPSLEEDHAYDTRLTIGISGDKLCTMQKSGRGGITRAELGMMIDVAFEKYGQLEKYL
ncbi:MAG: exosome complex protein Rrp42 [Candidatus Micrarchaeia archaeon]